MKSTDPNPWYLPAFGLALVFGSLFALLTPPSQAPDEPSHARRAWAISEGRLLPERRGDRVGGEVPKSVVDLSHDFLAGIPFHRERKIRLATILAGYAVPLDPDRREFIAYPNTALYGPVCYAPQAAAFAIGRRFTRSVLLLFTLGRLANALAAAALLALAVRAAPVFRPALFLCGLLPMAVFQAGSLSADAVTNGLAFLLTAWCLRSRGREQARMAPADLVVLLLLGALLALSKPGYLLLSGLVLLVPTARFGSGSRRVAATVAMLASTAGCAALWAAMLRERGALGSPASSNVATLRAEPASFLLRMLADLWERAPTLAVQFLGKLGWADVSVPAALLAAYGLVILLVGATGRVAPELRLRDRAIVAAIILATVCFVALPFSLPLFPPGPEGAAAHHFQGRYLLPLGPAGLLLVSGRRRGFDWDRRWRALAGWTALVLVASVVSVVVRYYG